MMLREKYKTFSGAAKRAAFERAVAPSEFRAGYKARIYSYRVIEHAGAYRVERYTAERTDTVSVVERQNKI
jgi:hypothetical protein